MRGDRLNDFILGYIFYLHVIKQSQNITFCQKVSSCTIYYIFVGENAQGSREIRNALGSEWPILPHLQLFQSFPTKVAQIDLEWPILPHLQLFQSFPTLAAQIDSEQPILPHFQLFQSFLTKAAQNVK